MIPIVEIIRIEENSKYGSFGAMRIQKEVFCWTLEPPDLLNTKNTSSIPAQQYICERHESPKFGETFWVRDVPGRDLILFHWGNWVRDTMGCILVGSTILKVKAEIDRKGVGNSGNTFKEFMTYLKGYDRFHLTIKENY